MKIAEFDSELLEKYISFLYHNHLGEFINFYHLKNLEELPEYFALADKEHISLINREVHSYLKSILKGTFTKEINCWIETLEEQNLLWVWPYETSAPCIPSLLHNRKNSLIEFLPVYTHDAALASVILNGIEYISTLQENLFFKRYIEKLEKNLSMARQILEHTPTHINVYDLDKDKAIYNNGAGRKLFGHTPEQVTHSKFSSLWLKLVSDADKNKVKKRIKNFKHLKDGETDHLEYRLKDKNDNLVWYYSKAIVFKRKNRKVKQVLLTGLNISELKQAEEERNYIELQLKEAQKNAHIANYDWDVENDVLKYTDEAYRIYEFPQKKKPLKLSDFKARLKPEDVSKFQKTIEKAFENPDIPYEGEYRIVMPDKTEKDILSRATITRNKKGKPIRMFGTVMDITSVKKTEYKLREKNLEIETMNQKLQESQKEINKINTELEERIRISNKELSESETWYKFIIENLPHLFWTATADGSFDFQNNNAEQYSGTKTEDLDSLDWNDYLHPDDYPRVLGEWAKAFETGDTFELEFRIKRYDGVYRWHMVKTVPLKNQDGKIIKWMSNAIDIDEKIRYARELKQKNKQLIKTNKDLDNFIYTASHDLKAPISNIEGLLTSLNSELNGDVKANSDVQIILDMMDSSVKKFQHTIFDLTEITKAQKSGEELLKKNNIEEILDSVESMIEILVKTSHATIKTDFKNCPTIPFSKKNLKSILYNLLSNAIKFRSPDRKPEIIVKTRCEDNYIELSVQDNGLGFDIRQKTKIFEMFRRLQSNMEGSGIGLYLVKRIITNAGGKIEAESEPGVGSTFKVYFPIKVKDGSS